MKSFLVIACLIFLEACNSGSSSPQSQISPLGSSSIASQLGQEKMGADDGDLCANLPDPTPSSHCGYDRCDQTERVRIACDFRNTVLDHYSGVFLKNKRLPGFNSADHLRDCVSQELSITDDDEVAFMDRLKLCVAGFQDTHFTSGGVRVMPLVQAPIYVSRVRGHYLVTAKLAGFLTGDAAKIDFGTEVLQIDGVDAATAAGKLAPYISGSTQAYRDDIAANTLFSRKFAYPSNATVQLQLKNPDGTIFSAALPWMFLASADRMDTNELFQKAGIQAVTDQKAFNAWSSHGPAEALFPSAADGTPLQVFVRGSFESNPTVALRMGVVSLQGKSVGYLELQTFENVKIYGGANHDQEADWLDTIRTFVSTLKQNNQDLILDLRYNGGGEPYLADDLMSILTESGKTYGGGVLAYRVTDSQGGLLWSDGADDLSAPMGDFFSSQDISKIFSDAFAAGQLETPLLVQGDIHADLKVGGYSGRIAALVTDRCISACDRMAAHLSRSGRATLIGTPSNGTGMGFEGDQYFYDWVDWHSLVTAEIPVHLFGVAPQPLGPNSSDHILPFDQDADIYLTENRPTLPDIAFEPQISDVIGQTAGWASVIAPVLSPAK